jgi:hypothetical protein
MEPVMQIKKQIYETLDGSKKSFVQKVGDGSIICRFEKTPLPKNMTDVICPHFLELKWALTSCKTYKALYYEWINCNGYN